MLLPAHILCVQPIVYNNTHCASRTVSNPSPFTAALKILGILPYSLLLVDLIFLSTSSSSSSSPPRSQNQLRAPSYPDQMKANSAGCRMAFHSAESQAGLQGRVI